MEKIEGEGEEGGGRSKKQQQVVNLRETILPFIQILFYIIHIVFYFYFSVACCIG